MYLISCAYVCVFSIQYLLFIIYFYYYWKLLINSCELQSLANFSLEMRTNSARSYAIWLMYFLYTKHGYKLQLEFTLAKIGITGNFIV